MWGVGFRVQGFTPATTASSTSFLAYSIPPPQISPNYIAQCMGGHGVGERDDRLRALRGTRVGEERGGEERETTGYEPYVVHAPILISIQVLINCFRAMKITTRFAHKSNSKAFVQ